MNRRISLPLLVVSGLLAALCGARAQIVLPGAVAPTPAGSVVKPQAAPMRKRSGDGAPRAAAPKAVAVVSLAGQTFLQNGRHGQIAFAAKDKLVVVTRLQLTGQKLSNARTDCTVEVPGAPFTLKDLGHPAGLARLEIEAPACPLTFDVVNGAILASGGPSLCEFKEADCKAAPQGLWGPPPGTLGGDRPKTIDRELASAEATVQANFRRLLATTKDKAVIRGIASEQAGFSSRREEICRDYAGEDKHGFCAARVTEARAAALAEQAGAKPTLAAEAKPAKPRRRPKPKAAIAPGAPPDAAPAAPEGAGAADPAAQ